MNKRLVGIVSLILVIAIGLSANGLLVDHYIKSRLQAKLINEYAVEEKSVSEGVAASLKSQVENIKNSLYAIAFDNDIQSGNVDVCDAKLAKFHQNLNLGIGNLGRVGLDGKFRCSINKALVGTPASKLGNYLDPLFTDPSHPAVVSRQLKVPNVAGYIVAVHVPVYDAKGQFVGSLGGAIYLNDLINTYLSKIKFAQTGFAGLQDDNGDILYTQITKNQNKNYFSPEVQSQIGNTAEFTAGIRNGYKNKPSIVNYSIGGIDKIASISTVQLLAGHNWIVIVNVPKSEIAQIFFGAGLNEAFKVVSYLTVISIMLIGLFLIVMVIRDYKLQKNKDEFVSLASHQLRTPATGVKQYLAILLHGYAGKLSPTQKEAVDEANQSNERQLAIIEDLLNVMRLDSGHLQLVMKSFDIGTVTKSVVQEMETQFTAKKLTLKLEVPKEQVRVVGDQAYLRMVIENLLSNAIKYTQTNGKIVLTLTNHASKVLLEVADNGVGIAPISQKKLFKKFSRINNSESSTVGGNGLGLYLVKKIVEQHGGQITLDSDLGRGSRFSVQLVKRK